MRRTYQTEWQDIPFAEFAEPSSSKLADPEFYQAFYEKFFSRYQNWDQLSAGWRAEKERCADFVFKSSNGRPRILSIGCGLGAMGHLMYAREPRPELFIHEVAPFAWRWIGAEQPEERKFLGWMPDYLPPDGRFDLACVSAVDYSMDDNTLARVLATIRPFLDNAAGTQCLIISASLRDRPAGAAATVKGLVRDAKGCVAGLLDKYGLRPRGQFWGWPRRHREYRA